MAKVPTIHLNGTDRETLLEGYMTALTALRKAERAVQATGPNGRDYYPQGEGAIRVAQEEHANRLRAIATVIREIEQIAESID